VEAEYPGRQELFGVVQKADGRLQVCVYHLNQSAPETLRQPSDGPSHVLDRLESCSGLDPRAKDWFARMVCDNQSRCLAESGPAMPRLPIPHRDREPGDICDALCRMGFKAVGQWSLEATVDSGVGFTLRDMADQRAIYAFTVDRDLKYMGVCQSKTCTLWDCMRMHQRSNGAGKEARLARLIRESLAEAETVAIWAWKPESDAEVAGTRVDLVRWLEQPLIQRFRPAWNLES